MERASTRLVLSRKGSAVEKRCCGEALPWRIAPVEKHGMMERPAGMRTRMNALDVGASRAASQWAKAQ
jgi:hypothetical protein